MTVFPTLFIEETVFSPLYGVGTLPKNQLTIFNSNKNLLCSKEKRKSKRKPMNLEKKCKL
jgi:hypothetical protein